MKPCGMRLSSSTVCKLLSLQSDARGRTKERNKIVLPQSALQKTVLLIQGVEQRLKLQ